MSTVSRLLLAIVATFATAAHAQMPDIDWELDDAIKQIDGQADNFETAMARVDFKVVDLDGNLVIKHSGNGFIRKDGDMRYMQDGGNRTVVVLDDKVSDYDAGAKTVNEYKLRDGQRLEGFYRLGFSVAGRDMNDRYLLTIVGEEEMGDRRSLIIELTPEREEDREIVGKIRLWIDQASWMPIRQEFSSTGDGNTTTIEYSAMARNLELNPDLFDDDWPRGTDRVRN